MKITKARLKELIKEEMSYMLEAHDEYPTEIPGEPDDYSDEDPGLGDVATEPRHDDPYEAVWNKLLIRHKLDRLSPEEATEALGLGNDEEVVEYIRTLQADKFYDPTASGGAYPGQRVPVFGDEPQL